MGEVKHLCISCLRVLSNHQLMNKVAKRYLWALDMVLASEEWVLLQKWCFELGHAKMSNHSIPPALHELKWEVLADVFHAIPPPSVNSNDSFWQIVFMFCIHGSHPIELREHNAREQHAEAISMWHVLCVLDRGLRWRTQKIMWHLMAVGRKVVYDCMHGYPSSLHSSRKLLETNKWHVFFDLVSKLLGYWMTAGAWPDLLWVCGFPFLGWNLLHPMFMKPISVCVCVATPEQNKGLKAALVIKSLNMCMQAPHHRTSNICPGQSWLCPSNVFLARHHLHTNSASSLLLNHRFQAPKHDGLLLAYVSSPGNPK